MLEGRKITGTILIVDDEEDLRFFVGAALRRAGWQIHEAGSGEAAITMLAEKACDVVLLDLRMARTDGLTTLREIKARWPDVVVIIMTAYASLDSAITAVRQGAFDYLRKPCSLDDVLTCTRRALEHKKEMDRQRHLARQAQLYLETAGEPHSPQAICSGALVIEPEKRAVQLAGRPVALTPTEYALLEILARSPGQPVPTEQLIRQGLGYTPDNFNTQETLRVHISRLRRKLGARYILTARGGYALVNLPPLA